MVLAFAMNLTFAMDKFLSSEWVISELHMSKDVLFLTTCEVTQRQGFLQSSHFVTRAPRFPVVHLCPFGNIIFLRRIVRRVLKMTQKIPKPVKRRFRADCTNRYPRIISVFLILASCSDSCMGGEIGVIDAYNVHCEDELPVMTMSGVRPAPVRVLVFSYQNPIE